MEGAEDRLQMLFPTVVQVSQIKDAELLNRRLVEAVYAIPAASISNSPSMLRPVPGEDPAARPRRPCRSAPLPPVARRRP